jgi:type IV pilus assembly protein PilA
MNTCPRCAKEIAEGAQFCQFCGKTLGSPGSPLTGVAPQLGHTSGKAIGSLVSGIMFFFLPAAIVAVVLGHLSLSEITHSSGRIRGRGMALTGLILGYAGIAFIPVILILAAIAIPNLLRAKMAANEASAVGSLRSYSYAAGVYAAKCPAIGFPKSLANLGPGRGDCERAALLDGSLGTSEPVKSGYAFHYAVLETDHLGQATSFSITAEPVNQGATGMRHFYVDYTGVVRMNTNCQADSGSPAFQ